MLQSVAHHQVIYVEQEIIYRNLIEHLLRDGDMRRLVFDNHPGAEFAAVEHAVGTQHLVAAFQLNLVGEQRGRVALVLDEIVYEVLAHPFFGRDGYVFPAQHIQYLGLLFRARNLHFEGW